MKVDECILHVDDDYDIRDGYFVAIDGKIVLRFADGEPEDASLCRDFNDVYSIADLLAAAHSAGVLGKPFAFTTTNVTSWDAFDEWEKSIGNQ